MKISIEATRLACPELKDGTHFLPLPLLVPIAEFDPADQCVGCGMSVRPEMLCDGKTRRILVNASEMFTKTFLPSAPSLADVNGRAATAGDAVNQTGGQASEGISWLSDPLAPEDRFRWNYGHKYGNVGVDMDKYLRVL